MQQKNKTIELLPQQKSTYKYVNVNNESVINNTLEEENNVSDIIVFDVDIGNSVPYDNIHGYLTKMNNTSNLPFLYQISGIVQERVKQKSETSNDYPVEEQNKLLPQQKST